jgi:hypothetical protein
MTAFLGGSILLIGVSAVALVMGWLNANETYIWTSIASTGLAGILLAIAYARSKREPPATAVAPVGTPGGASGLDPEIEAAREERASQKYSRATVRGPLKAEREGGEQGTVVAVPKTKKFHSPTCRFASAKDTERMDRAAAMERGFNPCGVCKP